MNKTKVIAIDGPSGSGKSTIAKSLSEKLNLTYLDTGALFRTLALGLHKSNIKDFEVEQIENFLNSAELVYAPNSEILVELNGVDFTRKIREHEVSALASKYSKVSSIRTFLKNFQREIATKRASILEGRDIGTVIFPDAAIKIFLTADPAIRAERRYQQLKDLGKDVSTTSVAQIATDIAKRDKEDSGRDLAPLIKADDAIEIDTTALSINQVIEKIIEIFNSRKDLF